MKAVIYAPEEFWQLTDRQRKALCNGCGTKGLGGFLVPDTIWGLCITPVCDVHDFMYATGGPCDADKDAADRVFLNNLIRLIEAGTRFGWLKKLRTFRAYTYFLAVRHLGGPAYWSGKNKPAELGFA